jgi:carbamate kinase
MRRRRRNSVIYKGSHLEGIAAVIDKDYASAKVAALVDADYLVILTAVDNAYINYRKPGEKRLRTHHDGRD